MATAVSGSVKPRYRTRFSRGDLPPAPVEDLDHRGRHRIYLRAGGHYYRGSWTCGANSKGEMKA
jgi:hypothetical protein